MLRQVLPRYVRYAWGVDVPYKRWFEAWQAAGVTVLPNHYYSPVPDLSATPQAVLEQPLPLHGIDMDPQGQLALLDELAGWRSEYEAFAGRDAPRTDGLWHPCGRFARPDADCAYAIVRKLKPRRIVEIGSGFSTLAMSEACLRNKAEGRPVEFLSIDPYPSYVLATKPKGLTRHVAEPAERLGLELVADLSENDILFIDSTHIIRPGGDVEFEYFHLLPKLKPGVWVHVHDIFLPAAYPTDWLKREHVFWNEQQLLAAFLAYNDSFKTRLALAWLAANHRPKVEEVFPDLPAGWFPGSFWMQRVR